MSSLPPDARAVVVTASNRASAGVYEDRSGQALAAGLRGLGFTVEGPHVRPDDVAELADMLLVMTVYPGPCTAPRHAPSADYIV